MHKPRVFLSYARENIAQVEELYSELVDAGIQPWLDTVDLLPGQDWELAIKSAIRQADFFIVCLSAQSVAKRGYVQREVKRALELWDEKLENDIYLIPARLDNCDVPPSLSKFQWVDLYDEYGFSRLIKAIEAGQKARSSSGADRVPDGEETDVSASGMLLAPKYFYYVSRPKVEMLLPQFGLSSVRKESDVPVVTKAIRLLDALGRTDAVLPLSDTVSIDASHFYTSKTVWHSGLFYFRTMVSVTVAYFLWRKYGQSMIVLTGSPDNIIGTRVARHGARLSSTGDAIDTIGSSEILDVINSNEVCSVVLGSGGRTSRTIPRAQKSLSIYAKDREKTEPWLEEPVYTRSREVGLAVFCLGHLSSLPEMTIDTMFRIYSTYSSNGANLFEDLEAEHKEGQREYAILYTAEGLNAARKMGMADLRTIYIGSPLYTAIG